MKTILIIEDESALQKTIGGALENEMRVVSALDGEIGVRLAKENLPDLILLDLVLPKKDGFAVLEELKADPKTKEIPVIVLTNLEDMADIQRALDLGATTYLVKSNYQLEDVVQKVRETMA
ncbi:MAG: response regulator [bacterium]|nr:response regulator [bacterium]